MSETLFHITKDLVELQELANESDGVDETLMQAYVDTMEGLQLSFEEKAQSIINISKNVTANIGSIDAEIKRLQAKKSSIQQKDEWFKNKLRQSMRETGIKKINCPLFSITLAAPTWNAEIIDESVLPEHLYEVETKIKPNKAEIAKRLKAGEKIDGAHLVESKQRLLIK